MGEDKYIVKCIAITGKGNRVYNYGDIIEAGHVNDINYQLNDGAVELIKSETEEVVKEQPKKKLKNDTK